MEGGGGGGGAAFLGFVMIFIIGYLAWFTFIGPDDPSSKNPFICPPPPLGNGRTYHVSHARQYSYAELCGTYNTDATSNTPPFTISLGDRAETLTNGSWDGLLPGTPRIEIEHFTGGPKETDPTREYVVISADARNRNATNISGWRIGSLVSGGLYTIPQASTLPISGSVNVAEDIWLEPGAHAVVGTGRSPIGISFRTNRCTGYFGQHQLFVPALARTCPLLKEHSSQMSASSDVLGANCFALLNSLGRCAYHDGSLSAAYSDGCRAFIASNANYSGCVATTRGEPNFYGDEWRVYLGLDQEIWRSDDEIIRLYTAEGKVVDTLTY